LFVLTTRSGLEPRPDYVVADHNHRFRLRAAHGFTVISRITPSGLVPQTDVMVYFAPQGQ
jgi:hypothetical protein